MGKFQTLVQLGRETVDDWHAQRGNPEVGDALAGYLGEITSMLNNPAPAADAKSLKITLRGLPGLEGDLVFWSYTCEDGVMVLVNDEPIVAVDLQYCGLPCGEGDNAYVPEDHPGAGPKIIVGTWPNGEEWERVLEVPTPVSCECDSNVVPGALYSADTGTVERCDSCQRFDGDLDAALAVANAVGGEAWVIFHREGTGDLVVDDQVVRLTPELAASAGDDWTIAEGTDPWVVLT